MASGLVRVQSGAVPAVGSEKTVLTWDDFSYVGSFLMPFAVNGGATETPYSLGLTHRYYGSTLHFFAGANSMVGVYDVVCPVLKTSAFNTATEYHYWGDISGGKAYSGMGTVGVAGLWWDETDDRMYWNAGNFYNTDYADDPAVGYSTLNFTVGAETVTGVGTWKFTGRGCKATQGGCTPIPAWFATAYCGGKRIGVGYGGPRSAIATGPAHFGPALCAIDPPVIETYPNQTTIPYTNLVGYPYNAVGYTTPDRCHRDANYDIDPDHPWADSPLWAPQGEVGYIQQSCFLNAGGCWIDTNPTSATDGKSGFLMFAWLSTGTIGYENSDEFSEGGEHSVFIYDPADLALVAQGSVDQDQIQPTQTNVVFPAGSTYPLSGRTSGLPQTAYLSATYDSTTGYLYVMVAPPSSAPWNPYVHCYQVS